MIRRSLEKTKSATFAVLLPNAAKGGMPSPAGTGFFISPDGYFLTAAHVVTDNSRPDGAVRKDIAAMTLEKERKDFSGPGAFCQHISLVTSDPVLDFALLKADFQKNSGAHWLNGLTEFPYLQCSDRILDDGEPVYTFGYPLSSSELVVQNPNMMMGTVHLAPRVTSAIVSSKVDVTQMIATGNDPKIYVLDKALNYGNSGGPVLATETGNVHAYCSRFQPMLVPQPHLKDNAGKPMYIVTPSLYGIVSSLSSSQLVGLLHSHGIPLVTQ